MSTLVYSIDDFNVKLWIELVWRQFRLCSFSFNYQKNNEWSFDGRRRKENFSSKFELLNFYFFRFWRKKLAMDTSDMQFEEKVHANIEIPNTTCWISKTLNSSVYLICTESLWEMDFAFLEIGELRRCCQCDLRYILVS